MPACTDTLAMERVLRIFSLPVQLMIHLAFTRSTQTLKTTQVMSATAQAVYSSVSWRAWLKHRYSFSRQNKARQQAVPFQIPTGEKKPQSLFLVSLPTPIPSLLAPAQKYPAPFGYWHYWHKHSSCLTTAIERDHFLSGYCLVWGFFCLSDNDLPQ